jgi:TetR/AcrR family transcriptional repressor of bet genes
MPKLVDHAERRRSIATAAIDVIGTAGVEGTRLRDVAKAAAVTTGAVAHYFRSKDEVLEAALREIVARTVKEQRASAARKDKLLETAYAFLPLDEERRRAWRVWLSFWSRALLDERLRRQHLNYYEQMTGHLVRLLREMQSAGRISKKEDCVVLADAMAAAVDGIGLRATLEPDQWPAERQRATLRRALVAILASASANPAEPHTRGE